MAKKKKELPEGFEEVDGKIIHTESGQEYEWNKNDLVNKETGQAWIDMSHAYKNVTKLPGVPVGHITMVYGKSDTGKSTMAIEAAAYAQKLGVVPVFIITENKFSFERAETMGVDFDDAIVYNGVETIEQGCEYVRQLLEDQEKGDLPYDILIIWDSIGATPSERELEAVDSDSGSGGMMVTAKVLREQISRNISYKINGTRNENFPYNASMIIVNHAYTAPPAPPARVGSVVPYGGDAIFYSAGIVIRMGGVMSRSSKVTATKGGTKVAFGLKSAVKVEKNHITNVAAEGKIVCTDHGFIEDDKTSIDNYKKDYKDGWDLEFDKYWDAVTLD
jgi:RecA/RadA recombinase